MTCDTEIDAMGYTLSILVPMCRKLEIPMSLATVIQKDFTHVAELARGPKLLMNARMLQGESID